VTNVYSAEKLLDWINKQLAKTYLLSDATAHEAALSAGSHLSDIVQAVASVHDIEEATATAFQIMLDERLLTSENRGPFIQFLQLLVVHHPSKRCRKGTADLLVDLADLWPVGEPSAVALQSRRICGDSSPGSKG
jgi:thiol oxidase